jgi:ATP-dependent Lon protease
MTGKLSECLYMNNNINQLYQSLMLGDYSGEGDLIQLITDDEDDEQILQENYAEQIPILSVRNTVLFPGVVIPITVGRQRSIKLVKKAQKGDKLIGVCAQVSAHNDDPGWEDIYQVGTLAKIIKMIVLPDGNTTIIIQGKKKVPDKRAGFG